MYVGKCNEGRTVQGVGGDSVARVYMVRCKPVGTVSLCQQCQGADDTGIPQGHLLGPQKFMMVESNYSRERICYLPPTVAAAVPTTAGLQERV